MKNFIVVHGPNLNLLGEREPEVYGSLSLTDINTEIKKYADGFNFELKFFQSNSEGALIDFIHEQRKWSHGIIINPGAYTHYSYALRDAISSVSLPAVEVHLSDITKREEFRKHSVIEDICSWRILGLGFKGYLRAIQYFATQNYRQNFDIIFDENKNWDQVLKDVVSALKKQFPSYSWAGIYLVEGEELVIHNYIGKPTPHERIPIGQGICGAAVAERESIIIEDVNADPRYLACSIETKSEIVVPIYVGEKIVGEIDIDSDRPDNFNIIDKTLLEECAHKLSGFYPS